MTNQDASQRPLRSGALPDEDVDDTTRIRHLWVEYKRTGDRKSRDELIIEYSPLVRQVAARVGAGLPSQVEHADLISYGVFGLIDAIDKYDPESPVKLETSAISRIRGAIIDELRSLDWTPRSIRSRAREIERAYASLEAKLHRTPTDAEMAEFLEVTPHEYRTTMNRLSNTNITALDEVTSRVSDRTVATTPTHTWPDSHALDLAGHIDT